MPKDIKLSVIICSINRPKSLERLILSLNEQSFQDYELITIGYPAPLVKCKNDGILKASGELVLFLDDDVVLDKDYIMGAVRIMDGFPEIVGVSGITKEWEPENRDSQKYCWMIGKIYNYFFMGGGVVKPGNNYGQEVSYLEPSNYMVKRKHLLLSEGFDNYEGVAEWSDVDFHYTIKKFGKLWNSSLLRAIHRPVKDATYEKRLDDIWHRYRNFKKFADKHLKNSWKLCVYKLILITYFWLKERKWI
jgi:glycosyltransferase involved in cell wall biosynthesis